MKLYRQLLPFAGACVIALGAGAAFAQGTPPDRTQQEKTPPPPATDTEKPTHVHDHSKMMNEERKTPDEKMESTTRANADNTPMTDAELLSKLHMKNTEEIELGKLAQEKGSSAEVKKYGKMMVDDHTKADQMVMDLAKKKSLTLTAMTEMDPDKAAAKQAEKDAKKKELETATGKDFDRAFLTAMHEGHSKLAMKLRFEKDRKSAHDKEVAALIDKLLPKIEHHRDEAGKALKKLDAARAS